MATAKYELIEKCSNSSLSEMVSYGNSLKSAWEENKRKVITQANYDIPLEHEIHQYKDKNITEYEEAFAHLQDVEITKDNAFLLRPERSGLPRFARNDGGLDGAMA